MAKGKEEEKGKEKDKGEKEEVGKIHEATDDVTIRKGDYRIQVQLLEAREIIPHKSVGMSMFGNKEGSCDPLIEVQVGDQKKRTEYQTSTLSPIFNESLFFTLTNVQPVQLEQTVIKLSLFDHNSIATNSFLGCFTIDAAYIYQMNGDHELYRKWVTLTDTTDATEGPKGYLRCTINVLGPGDRPPVHDERRDLKDLNDNGTNDIFSPGHVNRTGLLVKMNIYRAEHLPPLDAINNKLDPFIKVSFAGVGIRTDTVYNNRNPEFNEQLRIPVTLPCMNRKIR